MFTELLFVIRCYCQIVVVTTLLNMRSTTDTKLAYVVVLYDSRMLMNCRFQSERFVGVSSTRHWPQITSHALKALQQCLSLADGMQREVNSSTLVLQRMCI